MANLGQTYSYARQHEIYEMQQLGSLICGLAVTETNLHCAQVKKGMTQMQVPEWFDHTR